MSNSLDHLSNPFILSCTESVSTVKFKIITVTEEIEKCSQVLARFLVKETTRADMEDTAERYKNALMELAGLGRIKDPKILTLFPVNFKQLMVSVYLQKDETYSITYFPESYVLGLSKFDRIFNEISEKTSGAFRQYVCDHLPKDMVPSSISDDAFSVSKRSLCQHEVQTVKDLKSSVQMVMVDAEQESCRLSSSLAGYELSLDDLPFIESSPVEDCKLAISFESVCAHHTFPFFGTIYIQYTGPTLDLERFQLWTHYIVKRFQTQEDITVELYDYLNSQTMISNLKIRIVSEHTCMTERGVRAHDALTVTEMPL